MTNQTSNKVELAQSLVGQKVVFSNGAGIVKSFLVDGGDFETNHHVEITISTPNGEYHRANPENITVVSDEDYADCIFLSYGI